MPQICGSERQEVGTVPQICRSARQEVGGHASNLWKPRQEVGGRASNFQQRTPLRRGPCLKFPAEHAREWGSMLHILETYECILAPGVWGIRIQPTFTLVRVVRGD